MLNIYYEKADGIKAFSPSAICFYNDISATSQQPFQNQFPKNAPKATFLRPSYSTALNASSRSSIISAIFSVPMERRIVFGFMPCSKSSSSVH